jgi:exopolysaccharide biosynthesis operon protein EpsL
LALAIGALFSASAWAGPSDALHVYGGLGWAHDDNLFRIPESQPAFDDQRGDSWASAEIGLLFDHMYSRQRIAVVAKLSEVKFDHFKELNYTGKDGQGIWYWQLGNHLEGKLGASYNQMLAPYTDFQSSERNLRQDRKEFFDGAWRFHPGWRVRGAYSSEKFTYGAPSQAYNDRTEDTSEVEGDYLPASGSTVGLVVRRIEGSYPNRRPSGQTSLTDDFTQDELKARVNWLATGTTTVEALIGWARRDQPSYGERTSGFNGRASATYTPRGKLSYIVSAWRDFAPIESTTVSYTLNKGASVGATWDATAKIKVDASAIYERRDYSPRVAVSSSDDSHDAIRSASVRAVWTVRPAIVLSAGYVFQARTGSVVLGTGSFKSNSVSFNASAQF